MNSNKTKTSYLKDWVLLLKITEKNSITIAPLKKV